MKREKNAPASCVGSVLFQPWLRNAVALAIVIAPSAAQDIGYEGPSFSSSVVTPTESKPQSKLWYNDGYWWGSIWSVSGSAYRIHRLNFLTHAWVDTGVVVESRPTSHSDALWDGTKLYIASHRFSSTGSTSGNPIRLFRYSYDAAADTYSLDSGFPVTIGDFSTEALVIDKDSTGRVWAAWTQSRRVRIAHSLGSDTSWSSSVVLPTNTTNINADDICSLIHFNGDRIGVLWSDQVQGSYRFSYHLDGAADTVWSAVENVTSDEVDDHLDLAADSTGRVFLAGKDEANRLLLLVRGRTGGWSRFVISNPTPILTRPIVLLNEEARRIHVFATGQDTGEVFEKTSSMDQISFGAGTGTIRMRDSSAVFRISDPTSTKQNIDTSSGLVVLAHHDTTRSYWHHEVVPPPTADFSASRTSGVAPQVVAFTDATTGPSTSRVWNFGDGSTSSSQNPSHTYAAGTFTVSLTSTGPGGSDTETKTGYIVILPPPPVANFSAVPTSGFAPLSVAFSDSSTGVITSRLWSFGDGGTSTATNPGRTFAAGTYTVSLTTTGPGGEDIETKTDFIVVTHPPPVANFSASPTSGVTPLNVTFTDASTGAITSRLWTFGDGGTSTATSPSHIYSAGTYTVSLTTTGPGGSDTETKTDVITVSEPVGAPVANFNASPTTGTAPLAVAFTDASGGTISSRLWSFGDGGTSSATSPGHTYAAGTYSVSLTVTGPGGSDTETKTNMITVSEPSGAPLANFSASPTTGAAPLAVAFTDASSGTITSRLWSFGDGGTSSAASPGHTYAAGTYTVSLTVTGPGGSDTETKANMIVAGAASLGLMATVETAPVPSNGDSADDVAVWIHPTDRSLSTVIGTDKNSGLAVYDLAGRSLQFLPDGRLNNVDLRYGFPLGGTEVALVTAGERVGNLLRIYAVDENTRLLRDVAARAISPGLVVHGSCMFRSPVTGNTYFFGTSKDGDVEQWRLFDDGTGRVDAQLVRAFTVGSQVEGCVADDEAGFLFLSEEAEGIWRYGAEPDAGPARLLVDSTGPGGHLTEDVEGLTIYYGRGGTGYLLASSQGSSTFEVYERRPPHGHLLSFQIGENVALGIDAVSGTDGIDVVNLGLGSAFPDGVFVVQDGSNPGANQNFKLVPWPAIAAAANPPLLVDTSYDPHGFGCTAEWQYRNGSGSNPFVLFNRTMPRLGTMWECDLDCSGHAPAPGYIFATGAPSTGSPFPYGELLVDVSSPRVFRSSELHAGNTIHFAFRIPANPALCGIEMYVQGLCQGAPGGRLTNAIDLRMGK